MNWDQIAGNWKQAKGKVKEKWGKLTDDQLDVIDGKRDQLIGRLQELYGYSREKAEQEVKPGRPACAGNCFPIRRRQGRDGTPSRLALLDLGTNDA